MTSSWNDTPPLDPGGTLQSACEYFRENLPYYREVALYVRHISKENIFHGDNKKCLHSSR